MKRYLFILFLLVGISLHANKAQMDTWTDNKGSIGLSADGVMLFNYDRVDLSLKDQDKDQMQKNIALKLCKTETLRNIINSGTVMIYNYVYKEGIITIVVNKCNSKKSY